MLARVSVAYAACGSRAGEGSGGKWFEKAVGPARDCQGLAPEWAAAALLEGLSLAGAGRQPEAKDALERGLRSARPGGANHRRMAILHVLMASEGTPDAASCGKVNGSEEDGQVGESEGDIAGE